MKAPLLIALLLCGCVAAQKNVPVPSTTALQLAVDAAAGSAQKAARSTASARGSLRTAAARSRMLLSVAQPEERPLVMQLQTALDAAQSDLETAQEALDNANGALADSSGELEGLQRQISGLGSELAKAREEAERMSASRDFWRACTWKLALLALALGVWAFRKPLLALAGL